jgi:DNA-binding transcriptional LysR family regulator
MDIINVLKSYNAVVEKQSFSAAAKYLKISVAQVSKQISWLEEQFHTDLVQRSTRRIIPTEAGKLFFQRTQLVLSEWNNAKNALEYLQKVPQGPLKISVPSQSFGICHIAPNIPEFLRRYPQVHVDLIFEPPHQTAIDQTTDIAIRIGELKGTESFHAIKIGNLTKGVFATPEYLNRYGAPKIPEDILQHNCLVFLGGANSNTCFFKKNKNILISGNYSTNSVYSLRDAIKTGMGLGRMSHYWANADICSGALVEVLTDFVVPGDPIYLIYRHQLPLPLPIQSFINFIKEIFSCYLRDPQ